MVNQGTPRVIVKIGCEDRNCPTVYEIDDETLVVQGYKARELFSGDDIPATEDVVRIPKELIRKLIASGLA